MAVTSLSEWSTTAGSNTELNGISLAENVMRPPAVNNAFREMMAQLAAYSRRGADLATAATLNLDSVDTDFLDLTGTTTVTAVTLTDTHSRRARAAAAFQFTASATLVVNGSTSTNYTTTAGDLLFFEGYSGGVVRVWALPGGAGTTFATNAQAVTGTSTVLAVNPANVTAVAKLVGSSLPSIANNSTDATNDIDFSAGAAFDINASTAPYFAACAALTKRLDADWSAGTGNGMRYSGAAIANTTYHLWAVWKDDGTQDYYADPSATYATVLGHLQAETGGASYTHMRRVASVIRSGGAILAFKQYGDDFLLNVPVLDFNSTNPGTSAVTRTLTVPVGIEVRALITGYIIDSGSANTAYFSALSVSDETAVVGGAFQLTENTGGRASAPITIWTNTSSQIRTRVGSSAGGTQILGVTMGWVDRRGQ